MRVYLDDFAVYGDRKCHVEQVRVAFQRLREHSCSLSPTKCKIGFEEGPLLGHVVFRGGLKVDPEKVQRILEMKAPVSREQVSSLWGTTIYHNRFISNLVGLGRPISSLIAKTKPFVWSEECSQAFNYIKSHLASGPIVCNPDWNVQFILNPSASEYAVAAVLMQNDNAGRAHQIYYASRLMTMCEVKYSSIEKLGYLWYLLVSNLNIIFWLVDFLY